MNFWLHDTFKFEFKKIIINPQAAKPVAFIFVAFFYGIPPDSGGKRIPLVNETLEIRPNNDLNFKLSKNKWSLTMFKSGVWEFIILPRRDGFDWTGSVEQVHAIKIFVHCFSYAD